MRRSRGVAVAIGLVVSLVLAVAAADRRPQGDITRIVPFVVAGLVRWAVVVGVAFGPRRGATIALVGGATFLLASSLYLVFVQPIDYAECEQLFVEIADDSCREHSDLGRAALLLIGSTGGAVLAVRTSRGADRAR